MGSATIRSAAIGAGLAVVLGACGNGVSAPSAAQLRSAENADAQLAALDTSIWGSATERSAGSYLGHLALNAPIDKCMSDHGLPFNAPYVDGLAQLADPGGANGTWTRPFMNTATSTNVRVNAETEAQIRSTMTDPQPGSVKLTDVYSKALRECGNGGDYESAASPEGAEALASDLANLVGTINDEIGSDEPYDECMKDAGYDTTADGGGYDGLVHLIRESAPKETAIPEAGQTNEAWNRYLAFEQEALGADRGCRLSEHVEVMAKLAPALGAFAEQHAQEIAGVRQGWRDIVESATAEGWADLVNRRP